MAHILHLAEAGTGKSDKLLGILRDLTQSRPAELPKTWVLLATRRQAMQFRQRLVELDDQPSVYFNIEFFTFYSLNARLLKAAGTPVRRLSRLTRHRLLSRMLAEEELSYFQRIADTRGFVSILTEFIDELKQAGVDVGDFAKAAHSKKEWEIARIYMRYQLMLKKSRLADVEGEGWLALATLRDMPQIAADVDLLLVDGYDHFTPVQAQMLAQLSRTIPEAHITLTDMPSDHAGSSPQRSALTRARLRSAFDDAGISLATETLAPKAGKRQSSLEQLSQRIFRDSPAATADAAVRLLAMPSPAEEVKAVLRSIKRRLLDGAQPGDVLVALRQWELYAPHFVAGAAEYSLPLMLHYQRGLHQSPPIAAFTSLLTTAPRFRRRDLLDALRSPYINAGLDAPQIDLLERISGERQFLGGPASDWLGLVTMASRPAQRDSEDQPLTRLEATQQGALSETLAAFFQDITAPARAPVSAYIAWLESLLDDSAGAARLSLGQESSESAAGASSDFEDIRQRDEASLKALRRILRDLAASDDALHATFDEPIEIAWRRFWLDLQHAIETTDAEPSERSRVGRVLVSTAAEARGLTHRHVYILGLSESLFPAEASEDPLFLDSERETLKARGILLTTQAERVDDQGLFYELVSLPTESLTLSRPTLQAGKPWLESHLWRAVGRVFPGLEPETMPVGSVVAARGAASGMEALLGVAAQLNESDASAAASALRVKNWILRDERLAAQWRRIERGRQVEGGRLSFAPHNRHSGIITAPHLLAEITRALGRERIWSASQLKDYGLCAFRFFANRLLKLEESREPELGFDAAQLGSLNHRILEETYRAISKRGLAIDEVNLQAALALFADAAERILDRAPELFGFRASATWQEEKQILRQRLAALIRQDFSPQSPLAQFGDAREVHALELEFRNLEIELTPEERHLRLAGYIDRVDRVDGKLVLVDYKSGTKAIDRRQMEIGRDFQMMVYALAMQSLLERSRSQDELAGGFFWHVRNLKASGVYAVDDEDDQAALDAARLKLADNLRRGRHGQFPVHATELENGRCARYCEYSRLCRLRVTSPHKSSPPIE